MIKYLVDLIYIAFAVITVWVFTKRGFVESVFKYGHSIMAGILTFVFGPMVGEVIYAKFVYNGIHGWVSEKTSLLLHSAADKVDVDAVIEELPFIVKQFLNPDEIKAKFGETITDIEMSAQEFAAAVSEPISGVISNLIAYVIVFLVAVLVLLIFGKLLDLIVQLPILRTVNTALGFIVGIGAAILALSTVTYVLSLIISVFGDVLSLQTLSSTSVLFGFFDKLHLFDLF